MTTTNTRPDTLTEGSQRLSTEAKASYKTTEFLAYVLVLIGIFIAAATVDAEGPGGFTPTEAWRLVTFLTIGYMISRGLAKAGSREPYWRAGTNSSHDGR